MSCNVQEAIELATEVENIPVIVPCNNVPVEIKLGRTLHIDRDLSPSQSERLLNVL